MTTLEPQRQAAEAICVEAHAQVLQVVHALRRLARQDLRRGAPDQAAARQLRLAAMPLGAIGGGQRGRETALGPVASGLSERRGGDERNRGLLARGAQRGVQTRRARAHHRHVGAPGHRVPRGGPGPCPHAGRRSAASAARRPGARARPRRARARGRTRCHAPATDHAGS